MRLPTRCECQRVEEGRLHRIEVQARETGPQNGREPMNAARNFREAFGSVIDGVHAGNHREQHLRCADVRRRLFPPDVLFARLQSQSIRRRTLGVDGNPDEPPRKRTLEGIPRREISGMRSAEPDRHAEALRRADDDISAPFARRGEQRQREQIGGHDEMAATRLDGGSERAIIADIAVGARVLQQHAERVDRGRFIRRSDHHVDAERRRTRPQNVDRLREYIVGPETARARGDADPPHQGHCLGRGGRFIEHRGIGDCHARQIGDHRLKVEERLEPSLRDLGLVGRVRGVPRRILKHVTRDHRRSVRSVVALADERLHDAIPRRDGTKAPECFRFGHRLRQRERRPLANRRRDECVDQCTARVESQRTQHRGLIVGARADVAPDERIVVLQRRERQSAIIHRRSFSCTQPRPANPRRPSNPSDAAERAMPHKRLRSPSRARLSTPR